MQNLPLELSSTVVMATGEPEEKVFVDRETGAVTPKKDFDGNQVWVIRAFVKPPSKGGFERLNSEKEIEFITPPEDGISMGTMLELVEPTVSLSDYTSKAGKRRVDMDIRATAIAQRV